MQVGLHTLWWSSLLFAEQMLAILVVGFGFWMSTHNDECKRSLTIPVMGLGGVIFLMYASMELHYPHCASQVPSSCFALTSLWCWCRRSLAGFVGAWKNISCLLWTVSFLWHLMDKLTCSGVSAADVLAAVLVPLALLSVALTCRYLVSNNAVRGPGGNHGLHSACVSSCGSSGITLEEPFQLVAIMLYFKK